MEIQGMYQISNELDLSESDLEGIISLTENGVSVTRNVMVGEEYMSVSWSFYPAEQPDDEDVAGDEPS